MRKTSTLLLVCCFFTGLGLVQSARAQLTVTFPFEGAVFQRSTSNAATINIGGSYTGSVDRIEARLIAVSGGNSIDWTVIHTTPVGGTFTGSLSGVTGGWYTLEVRSILFNTPLHAASLSRVGVGEVFIISGQSNVQGVENHGHKASTDAQGRVKYVSWVLPCPNVVCQNVDPPFPQFSTLNSTASGITLSPNGVSSWAWGELGDALIARYNVPVLFLNTAASGSTVGNWSRSADGLPSQHVHIGGQYGGNPNFPYYYLRKALNFYASMFGVRAVLWHQGESDTIKNHNTDPNDNTSSTEYRDSLQYVISRSRNHSNKILLSWAVARVSYYGVTDADVIAGQNLTVSTPNKIFPGPETDNIQIPRPDGVHLENVSGGVQGISELAAKWNLSLDNNFFANATPYSATLPPTLSLNCASGTYSITAPSGYQYFWVNGNSDISATFSNNQTIAPGAGTYRVYLKDIFGNTLVTPSVTIPNALPVPPSLSASSSSVAAGQSVTLYAQGCMGSVSWSTGGLGNSIVQTPSQTTTYSASCSIGSCASIQSSVQVSVCPANTTVTSSFTSGTVITVKASNAIIGTNSISAGAMVTYDAKNSVTLRPGFVAERNSTFYATAGVGCAND
ncbi:MAG: sialate O-acetylesterase [Spirosomataceae bacterium]